MASNPERSPTGSYEPVMVGGEMVDAFVPHALPPHPDVRFDPALNLLLHRALLACGRLDGVSALLPDPDLFLYAYIRREAVLSSQIEGTQSSLSDLLLFELDEVPGVPFDDVVEVSNYVAALQHGIHRLETGFPLSNRLIREIHAILMQGARGESKAPGEFRRTQNWLGGGRPSAAAFVPPPPARIEDCMSDLELYLHRDDVPALIKASLAHVQFETIHPFLDGNGRTGRLLIALVLHNEGVLRQPLLYLSLYLKTYRSEYYRCLDAVRTTGDWEGWLRFLLHGIEATANGAVESTHRLLTLFSDDERRIRESGRTVASLLRAHVALRARPIATVRSLQAATSLSYPTSNSILRTLADLGIVRELTGNKRNRFYAYAGYLDILNEGGMVR